MTVHWFTDPAANGPSVITPTFTEVELQALVEILKFAHDPANAEMELLLCMDAAGTCEHGRSTGRKAAPFTPEIESAIAAGGGVRLWHNHPSQDSLSHHDWLCAGMSDMVEVLALNAKGSIFVGRIVKWDDRLHGLCEWLPRLAADLEMHVDGLAKKRRLDAIHLVAMANLTMHMLNTALAKTTPVRYAYALKNADQMTIAAAGALSLIADGIAFAEQAIQEWLDKHAPASDAEPL
ncbi:hypothetical protein [Novosphingobium cyanobacteriorum]|uniref:RadC-like JAB domain-containing protein n=1 Tax=Novosphingobium cyanobacteriorum TaxID=3024215 RepID=A0ABT6CQ55_9SPHN|nr:hypothetical protein [Novosphingobium cyanobacteriorum]MDF8335768.1 hypothetical protein [Novosphingobium cyanobacteriorum]